MKLIRIIKEKNDNKNKKKNKLGKKKINNLDKTDNQKKNVNSIELPKSVHLIKILIINPLKINIDELIKYLSFYPYFYYFEIIDSISIYDNSYFDIILTINCQSFYSNRNLDLIIIDNVLKYKDISFNIKNHESEYCFLYLIEKHFMKEAVMSSDFLNVNKKLTQYSSLFIPFKKLNITKSINNQACKNPRLFYLDYLFKYYSKNIFYNNEIDYDNLDTLILIDIPDWAFDYLVKSYSKYLKNSVVLLFRFFHLFPYRAKRVINYSYWVLNKYTSYLNRININLISDFMAFNENYLDSGAKESIELLIQNKKNIIVSNQKIQNEIFNKYNVKVEILNEVSSFESDALVTSLNNYELVNQKITLGAIGNFNGAHQKIKKLDVLNNILSKFDFIFNPINSAKMKVDQNEIKNYIQNIDLMINFSEIEGAPRSIVDSIYLGKGFISRINSVAFDFENKAKYYNLFPCILFQKDEEFIEIIKNLSEEKVKIMNNDALLFSKILSLEPLIYASKIGNFKLKYNEISILMPVFNPNLIYFNRCLYSIKYQYGKNSFFKMQLVIVDDGSSSDFLPFLKKFNLDNSLVIKYIRLKENMGVSSALHIGLLECDYDFIVRMDYDDIMIKNRIFYQSFMYEHYEKIYDNLCILGGDMLCINNVNKFLKNYQKRPFRIDKENYLNIGKWYLNHPTICFNKENFLKYTNYPPFFRKNAEDLVTWIKLIESNQLIINDNKPVILYRIHNSQVTQDSEFKENVKKIDNLNDKSIFYKINHKEYIKLIQNLT